MSCRPWLTATVTMAFGLRATAARRPRAEPLLEHDADLDWVAPWEPYTPLDAATRQGDTELVRWLHDRGEGSAADVAR